jgi:heavy metal translocating P-type ATPase
MAVDNENNKEKRIKLFFRLNILLCIILVGTTFFYFSRIPPFREEALLVIIAVGATSTVFFSALRSLREKRISIDLLASIALTVSLVEQEWVSAIFINLMITSARTFINYVRIRSHSAINSLLKLKPTKVKIMEKGEVLTIPIERVKKGDRIIIELGERVPVDGIIEEGEATVDQSSLTGESLPVFKKAGEEILSFSTVASGHLIVRAEKVGQETTFEKIIALVERSQLKKAPIYALVDRFANWYVILTILGSFAVYLATHDVTMVLGLLLVSCADDIAIATPLALMSAVTHSAKHGAIIKGGDFLQALAKLKVMVFDKTGTLTRGRLKAEEVVALDGKKQDMVLKLAATASLFSNHPISKTIVAYAKSRNIAIDNPRDFYEHTARGMTAFYRKKRIITGKLSFLQEMKVKISKELISEADKHFLNGANVTLVAYDDKLIGYIVLNDELRPGAKEAVIGLKKLGIKKIVMLTGDNEKIAQRISQSIGIDEFHANLLPQDKINHLERYLNKRYKVAMVGDGVNDAPVLARADVGIAMGAIGSDAAIEAADVAMMKDDLLQIPELIKIGRATLGVISQNIAMWGILNVIGFSLVFLHILNPSGAAVYNFATDFIPIFNSLRLFK